MNKKYNWGKGAEILKLRAEGKTYLQITEQLNVSKGTVAYHCNKHIRQRTKTRTKWNQKNSVGTILSRKINVFKYNSYKPKSEYIRIKPLAKNWRKNFKAKIVRFKYDGSSNDIKMNRIREMGNYEKNLGSKDVL